jgi:hypothetical protein
LISFFFGIGLILDRSTLDDLGSIDLDDVNLFKSATPCHVFLKSLSRNERTVDSMSERSVFVEL